MPSRPRPLRNDFGGWCIVAFASMLWATDVFLRPKVLAAGLDAVAVVFLEHLALTVLFLPIVIRSRQTLFNLRARELGALLFISWAGSTLATVLITQAYVEGDPLTATLLQKLQPAFAVVLAGPILRERRLPMFWVWLGVALVGAYLISFGFSWIGDPLNHKGLVAAECAIGAAALWGSCTVVGRWSLGQLKPLPIAGLRFSLALPVLIVWVWAGHHLHAMTPAAVSSAALPLALIVLLPDALAMGLYYIGLERTSASLATLAELAYPATAILASFQWATKLTMEKWFGVALLVLSMFFIRRDHLVFAPSIAES